MASLAADENSGESQRIMGLGRILCSWGFAFKWVAISAEALCRFIMSLQPAACLWIKNVAWNQRSELSLFCQVCWDKMLPALLALSVSLSLHLEGPAGAAEPLAPYLTNCCHGNCCPLVILWCCPPNPNLANKPRRTLRTRVRWTQPRRQTQADTIPKLTHPSIFCSLQQVLLNIHDVWLQEGLHPLTSLSPPLSPWVFVLGLLPSCPAFKVKAGLRWQADGFWWIY